MTASDDEFKVEIIRRATVGCDILVEQRGDEPPTITFPYRVETIKVDKLTAARLADVMLCYSSSGFIDKIEVNG